MIRHLLPALAALLAAPLSLAQSVPGAVPPQANGATQAPEIPSIPGLPAMPGLSKLGERNDASDADPSGESSDAATTVASTTAAASDSGDSPVAPATPPGPNPDDSSASTKKVDFLQRSNLILSKLLESDRPVDPFGMIMDPANTLAAPILADQYSEVEETPVLNNSSLKNALLTLPITGVYPQRDLIVVGARSFHLGDQFGMKLQDLTIRLRFEGIRGTEIFFKDMETREVTSVPFNARPAEFEPMRKGSSAPIGAGIVPMSDLYIVN